MRRMMMERLLPPGGEKEESASSLDPMSAGRAGSMAAAWPVTDSGRNSACGVCSDMAGARMVR